MIDLNSFVPSSSGVQLTFALSINERGEIASLGVLPSGDQHAFVLIPCDDDHSGIEGCDYSMVDASTASVSPQPTTGIANPANQDGPAFGGAANPMLRRFGRRFGPWYRRAQAQPTK